MATSFSSLPIIDLHDLSLVESPSPAVATKLSEQLYDVFVTTGFAYLTNAPLTFSDEDVFDLAREFFALPDEEKMSLAKGTFQPGNPNTYRGYFPTQPLSASDNLKEGFEIGPSRQVEDQLEDSEMRPTIQERTKFDLSEPNVWPDEEVFPGRSDLERLHSELQNLSSQLLSLLAMSLGKDPEFFSSYLRDSLSTLRLLHYPPVDRDLIAANNSRESFGTSSSLRSVGSDLSINVDKDEAVKLSCTPHTDSGLLTLLHQDPTGGLEVRNSLGDWVSAPYIPGSIVVNIGDLMAEVSGDRFVATMHRVRAPMQQNKGLATDVVDKSQTQFGRFSVPFFFEPGEACVVRSVDDDGSGHGILYGEHVRNKMKTWVEFQDIDDVDSE